MLRLKVGVSLAGLSPQMALAARIVEGAYTQFIGGNGIVRITSAKDGVHCRPCPDGSPHSKHDDGHALDFGIKEFPEGLRAEIVRTINQALTPEFDVLWEARGTENEHLHIEWDP